MRSSTREDRFRRADASVLRRYEFVRTDEGDVVSVNVTGGQFAYVVTASRTWAHPPRCSCPDAQRADVNGYCKHTLAVLTRHEDLQCQLLEVYL